MAKHARDAFNMRRLAAMRSAGERKLFVTKRVAVGRPRLDERKRLQRLHRRTREDRLRHLADAKHRRPIGIGNDERTVMAALHQASARHFDKNRIAHFRTAAQVGPRLLRPVFRFA